MRTYQLQPGKLLEWEASWRRGLEARRKFVVSCLGCSVRPDGRRVGGEGEGRACWAIMRSAGDTECGWRSTGDLVEPEEVMAILPKLRSGKPWRTSRGDEWAGV